MATLAQEAVGVGAADKIAPNAQNTGDGEAMPLELDLGELKGAIKFAQGQAEQCQKNLERAQEKLDAKEDLLERTREDLLQAQRQTHDLKANLAQERDRRLVLERMRDKMLNTRADTAANTRVPHHLPE